MDHLPNLNPENLAIYLRDPENATWIPEVGEKFEDLDSLHIAMFSGNIFQAHQYLTLISQDGELLALEREVFSTICWYLHKYTFLESLITLQGIPKYVPYKRSISLGKAVICTNEQDRKKLSDQFNNDPDFEKHEISIRLGAHEEIYWRIGEQKITRRTSDFQVFSEFCLQKGEFWINLGLVDVNIGSNLVFQGKKDQIHEIE